MRLRLAFATVGALVALVAGAGAAAAQDYPGGTTTDRVDASQADRSTGVLSETQARPDDVSATGAVDADGALLPVTGGDVVGLTLLGAGLVGAGTVIVRRSRRAATI